MIVLENIIISAIGSTIPMVIVAIFGYFKWFQPYTKFKKMGVGKIFNNQQEAEYRIKNDIKTSSTLRVFSMRGNTFSGKDKIDDIANTVLTRTNTKQKYLISDPESYFVAIRAKELPDIDTKESLEIGIKASIEKLIAAKNVNPIIEVRKHKEVVRYRLILLDEYLYMSFQEPSKRSKESQMLKIKKGSSLYTAFSTLFDDLWEKYTDSSVEKT
jgi:hypothetical protein